MFLSFSCWHDWWLSWWVYFVCCWLIRFCLWFLEFGDCWVLLCTGLFSSVLCFCVYGWFGRFGLLTCVDFGCYDWSYLFVGCLCFMVWIVIGCCIWIELFVVWVRFLCVVFRFSGLVLIGSCGWLVCFWF